MSALIPDLFLTREELRSLTGLKRAAAQHRWLLHHGFTAMRRADGQVVVARAHALGVLGVQQARREQLPQPDWSALDC